MGVKMRIVITTILMLLATQSLGESKLDKQIKKIENFASKKYGGRARFLASDGSILRLGKHGISFWLLG